MKKRDQVPAAENIKSCGWSAGCSYAYTLAERQCAPPWLRANCSKITVIRSANRLLSSVSAWTLITNINPRGVPWLATKQRADVSNLGTP
jgi:hypothetical protein